MSKYASRACTLLAKVVQNLANLVPFGEKEPHMKVLNVFVNENMPRMKEFLDLLCAQVSVLSFSSWCNHWDNWNLILSLSLSLPC